MWGPRFGERPKAVLIRAIISSRVAMLLIPFPISIRYVRLAKPAILRHIAVFSLVF